MLPTAAATETEETTAPATFITPSSVIPPAAAADLRGQMPATVAGDTIRFDYGDGDTILAEVLTIQGEQMTVTFTANSGRDVTMNLGYPAPTPQLHNDWWPVAAGAAAPAGEMTPAVPPNADADATPAEATNVARHVLAQLFAQAQADKSERYAEPKDQLDELAKIKACEQEARTAPPRLAQRDLVSQRTTGDVREAAQLKYAMKMTQYDADIAAAAAADQEDNLDGGIDFAAAAAEIEEIMDKAAAAASSRQARPP